MTWDLTQPIDCNEAAACQKELAELRKKASELTKRVGGLHLDDAGTSLDDALEALGEADELLVRALDNPDGNETGENYATERGMWQTRAGVR